MWIYLYTSVDSVVDNRVHNADGARQRVLS